MAIMTFWKMVTGTFWLLLLAGPSLPDIEWHTVPTKYMWGSLIWRYLRP
jgi:hypothetical protein